MTGSLNPPARIDGLSLVGFLLTMEMLRPTILMRPDWPCRFLWQVELRASCSSGRRCSSVPGHGLGCSAGLSDDAEPCPHVYTAGHLGICISQLRGNIPTMFSPQKGALNNPVRFRDPSQRRGTPPPPRHALGSQARNAPPSHFPGSVPHDFPLADHLFLPWSSILL